MEKMFDNSAYQKVQRLIGRGRDSPPNSDDSVEEFIDGELERKDEYLIRNGAWLFRKLVKYSHGKNNSLRIFSLKELQKATNNFSADQILSRSDIFTRTYRGTIEDRHVAVKITWFLNFLLNEVVSLSLIKHRNVVKLLGCCLETNFPIWVHELPQNGTLYKNIFMLSWTDRLRIATEIADALSYLHSELHMIHRGLWGFRAVLLDEFHSAKVGTFERSHIQSQAEISSNVETDIRNNESRKLVDVFDFGSILLNLLCIFNFDKVKRYNKVEILKYLKISMSEKEKEMPQIEAYIDLLLRCQSSDKVAKHVEDGEDKVQSVEEVSRELRCIRSMINPQPTTDGNESDNLSSGAN